MNQPCTTLNYCPHPVVRSLTVIHYGSTAFDPSKFNKIRNAPEEKDIAKPMGGLWACPVDAEYSWRDCCMSNSLSIERLRDHFRLKFKDGSRIAMVDSYQDLESLPMIRQPKKKWDTFIDWELIASHADALWLTGDGSAATRLTEPFHLSAWFCESIVILNPGCCYQA